MNRVYSLVALAAFCHFYAQILVVRIENTMSSKPTKAAKEVTLTAANLTDRRLCLFNEKEACAVLGISAVTLWRLRRAGQISYRRVFNSLRYSEADLTEFLDRSKRAATVDR